MIDNPKEEEKNISENRQSKKTFIFCYFVLAFLFLLGVKKMLQRGKKKNNIIDVSSGQFNLHDSFEPSHQ